MQQQQQQQSPSLLSSSTSLAQTACLRATVGAKSHSNLSAGSAGLVVGHRGRGTRALPTATALMSSTVVGNGSSSTSLITRVGAASTLAGSIGSAKANSASVTPTTGSGCGTKVAPSASPEANFRPLDVRSSQGSIGASSRAHAYPASATAVHSRGGSAFASIASSHLLSFGERLRQHRQQDAAQRLISRESSPAATAAAASAVSATAAAIANAAPPASVAATAAATARGLLTPPERHRELRFSQAPYQRDSSEESVVQAMPHQPKGTSTSLAVAMRMTQAPMRSAQSSPSPTNRSGSITGRSPSPSFPQQASISMSSQAASPLRDTLVPLVPMRARILEEEDSILHQKIEAGQRMAMLRGGFEPGWQASIRQVRAEMLAQRAVQAEALSEQVGAIYRELQASRAAQSQICTEQVTAVRREVLLCIREERQARQGECAELRNTLEKLQSRLLECHNLLANHEEDQQRNNMMRQQSTLAGPELENIINEMEAERLRRCSQVADIHARIGREVADFNWHLEEQKLVIADELAAKTRLTEERHSALEKAVEREREHGSRECNELRAILDSVWQRVTSPGTAGLALKEGKSYYLRYEDENGEIERTKELVGDQEDINTLYEMVREALGDTVHLREQLNEDREASSRELVATRQQAARLEKQLNTTQVLMREASVCPECRPHPQCHRITPNSTSPPSLSSLPPVD